MTATIFYYNINYQIGSIFTLIVALLFGFLIFLYGKGGRIVKSYFLLMFVIATWSFGIHMLVVSRNVVQALLWGRFLHIGASFIPIFYFHFVIKLINLQNKQKHITQAGYILAALFAFLNFTPEFIKSVSLKLDLNFIEAGRFYPLFILYFAVFPAYAYYLSYKTYHTLTALGKRQLRYITIAGLFGFFGGGLVFFTVYGIGIPIFGPLALYFIIFANIFVAVATYSIQLIDVELIKRRTLVFSLLYGAVVGTFVAFVFIGQKVISARFSINRWVLPVATLFIITIFIRPLENLLVLVTDKVLYQKRYNYMVTLKNMAKNLALVTDTKRLLKLIVYFIFREMRATGCAIFIYDETSSRYILEVKRGFKEQGIADQVLTDSSLVEWLVEKKESLNYEDVLSWIHGERIFPHNVILKRTLDQIRVTMKKLSASLCVPSFLRGKMIGFLVLGAKLSGQKYTRDDMSLLATLSDNATIALENAHMYEELQKRLTKLRQLYQTEHQLVVDAASAFSYAIDTRDGYSHAHTLKVAECSVVIADQLQGLLPRINFDEKFYSSLRIASLLHDVGKIGIPDRILKKRGSLTPEEAEQIKQHTIIGEKILTPMKEMEELLDIIRHHHENFDGTGYPDGLKGDDIPIISRIITLANAYAAMTSERFYRHAIEKEGVIRVIESKAGTQFDPLIVKAFLKAHVAL